MIWAEQFCLERPAQKWRYGHSVKNNSFSVHTLLRKNWYRWDSMVFRDNSKVSSSKTQDSEGWKDLILVHSLAWRCDHQNTCTRLQSCSPGLNWVRKKDRLEKSWKRSDLWLLQCSATQPCRRWDRGWHQNTVDFLYMTLHDVLTTKTLVWRWNPVLLGSIESEKKTA